MALINSQPNYNNYNFSDSLDLAYNLNNLIDLETFSIGSPSTNTSYNVGTVLFSNTFSLPFNGIVKYCYFWSDLTHSGSGYNEKGGFEVLVDGIPIENIKYPSQMTDGTINNQVPFLLKIEQDKSFKIEIITTVKNTGTAHTASNAKLKLVGYKI